MTKITSNQSASTSNSLEIHSKYDENGASIADISTAALLEHYRTLLQNWSSRGKTRIQSIGFVLASYGAVFGVVSRAELFSPKSFYIPAALPLVPIVLSGWLVYETIIEAIEDRYGCLVEEEVQRQAALHVPLGTGVEVPLHSAFRLQHAATSPKYARGPHRHLAITGFAIISCTQLFCIIFAATKSHDLLNDLLKGPSDEAPRLIRALIDWLGAPTAQRAWTLLIVVAYLYLTVLAFRLLREMTIGGELAWVSALDYVHCKTESTKVFRQRRLISYVAMPRWAELISKQALEWVVALLVVLCANSWKTETPAGTIVIAFIVFDVLWYQTRYAINDYLGRAHDSVTYAFTGTQPRLRLPPLESQHRERFFYFSILARLSLALVGLAWFSTWQSVTRSHTFAIAVSMVVTLCCTVVYEYTQARLEREAVKSPWTTYWMYMAALGIPYGVRPGLVIYLAMKTTPTTTLLLAFALALMGVVSSGMTYVLQAASRGPGHARVTLLMAAKISKIHLTHPSDERVLLDYRASAIWGVLAATGSIIATAATSAGLLHLSSVRTMCACAAAVGLWTAVINWGSDSPLSAKLGSRWRNCYIAVCSVSLSCWAFASLISLIPGLMVFVVYLNLRISRPSGLEQMYRFCQDLPGLVLRVPGLAMSKSIRFLVDISR